MSSSQRNAAVTPTRIPSNGDMWIKYFLPVTGILLASFLSVFVGGCSQPTSPHPEERYPYQDIHDLYSAVRFGDLSPKEGYAIVRRECEKGDEILRDEWYSGFLNTPGPLNPTEEYPREYILLLLYFVDMKPNWRAEEDVRMCLENTAYYDRDGKKSTLVEEMTTNWDEGRYEITLRSMISNETVIVNRGLRGYIVVQEK